MRQDQTTHLARRLRRTQTDAERLLWLYLRGRRLGGYKFRRQVQIGNYIADFACLDQKLIVELDGGQHVERDGDDRLRTADLERRGYRVIRFWNDAVLKNTDAVLEEIAVALDDYHPSPQPSP